LLDEAGPVSINTGWTEISFRSREPESISGKSTRRTRSWFPPLQKAQERGTTVLYQ
jgi:hypothetical protein